MDGEFAPVSSPSGNVPKGIAISLSPDMEQKAVCRTPSQHPLTRSSLSPTSHSLSQLPPTTHSDTLPPAPCHTVHILLFRSRPRSFFHDQGGYSRQSHCHTMLLRSHTYPVFHRRTDVHFLQIHYPIS